MLHLLAKVQHKYTHRYISLRIRDEIHAVQLVSMTYKITVFILHSIASTMFA